MSYSEDPEVNAGLMQQASNKANQFNILAAVGAMSNNKQVAAATAMADQQQQKRYAAKQMGTQGFALPESGQFLPSPIYLNERESERAQRTSALEMSIAARKEQEAARTEATNQRAADSNALRMTLAQMGIQSREQLAAMARESRASSAAARAAEKPEKVDNGRILPGGEIRKLSKSEDLVAGFGDLLSGFKDEFGGSYGTVGAKNFIGRNMPGSDYAPQSNWWQNYNDQKNSVRNALFGSALTVGEGKAFDAANITEGMAPKEIKTRLAQQQAITTRAYNKMVENFGKSGYDVRGFSPATSAGTLPGGEGQRPNVNPPAAGGLSPQEQAELAALRKQFGK